MGQILIIISLLAVSATQWQGEVWRSKIFTGLVILTLWVCGIVAKRIHWSVALALLSTIGSSLSIFAFPLFRYTGPSAASFDAQSSDVAFYVLLMIIPFLFIDKKHIESIFKGVGLLCVFDSVFVLLQWALGHEPFHRGSFFGNSSINACLIAFTYPILAFKPSYRPYDHTKLRSIKRHPLFFLWEVVCVVLPVIAVFLSGSSMALGALSGACFVYMLSTSKKRALRKLLMSAAAVILIMAVGFLFLGAELFQDSDRFAIWRQAFDWWNTNANFWFGTGAGTYFLIGPYIQSLNQFREGNWWLWMHNDWLQLLFEQGFVGLSAFMAAFLFVIRTCIKENMPWLLASVVAYALTAAGNYPARLMVHGFLGVLFCVAAFKLSHGGVKKNECEKGSWQAKELAA